MAWFTEDDLRAAAGEASFQRGRDYVPAVGDLRPTALGVRAGVRGSADYEVWLGRSDTRLVGECDCPFGAGGNFCKHCVAVGLVVLDTSPSSAAGPPPAAEPELGAYLESLSHQELVALVREQAERDPALYRKLVLRAAGGAGAPPVAVLRRQIDEALRVHGYLDERATLEYARRAHEVLAAVAALVESGHAAEARPLARAAVEGIAAAMATMDDRTGAVVGVCRRAYSVYADACTAARPNPVKLAGWIVARKLDGPGWPTLELADFAAALGQAGLAEYRELVHAAARRDDPDRALAVRAMREQLAVFDGDLDAHVDLLAEGIPNPKAFLDIVTLLRGSGELAGAIRWAERGVEETGDPRLVDLLVETIVADGRPAAAVAVREAALRAAPTRLRYADLRTLATRVGTWPAVRGRALDLVRAAVSRQPAEYADELVGALLDDGEPVEAWQVAEKYGCGDRAWLEVARAHGAAHPAEVLAGYRRVIDNALGRTGRDAYREVGLLLTELRELSARCGEQAAFDALVADLRARHHRRRALLAELDRRAL